MSSLGRLLTIRVSHSATPMGRSKPRRAYSTISFVLRAAEQQSDGRLVVRMAKQVVHGGEVHVHLADEAGVEGDGLEFHHDVAAELQMVEEQIEIEVWSPDLQMDLSADEGEARAEFQQEALDVVDQGLLDLPLAARVGGAEEVEQVGVLEDLGGHVRFGGRQGERRSC